MAVAKSKKLFKTALPARQKNVHKLRHSIKNERLKEALRAVVNCADSRKTKTGHLSKIIRSTLRSGRDLCRDLCHLIAHQGISKSHGKQISKDYTRYYHTEQS